MSPVILLLGFAIGLHITRLRVLAVAALALGILWGLIGVGDGFTDFPEAAGVGAANAAVGIAFGVALHLLGRGLRHVAVAVRS